MILLILSACTSGINTTYSTEYPGTFSVDAQLKEFYSESGGMDVLGPAISEVSTQDYQRCQFMANARICVNTNQHGVGKYSLTALGRQLGIPLKNEVSENTIFPDFIPMIQQLGEANVGRPLEKVRYNYQSGRIEQYFEKVGFFIDLNQAGTRVQLLPYGDVICGNACPYNPAMEFAPLLNEYDSIFSTWLDDYGGEAFSGVALTPVYHASDGSLEQVFTNVVVYSPADAPQEIILRPLPQSVGIQITQPVNQQFDITDNMVFVQVSENMGFHIPIPLDNYISMHGGLAISGFPLSEISLLQGKNIYQQCFAAYCLNYDPYAAEAYKILPAPLGVEYLNIVKPVFPGGIFQPDELILDTRVLHPRLSNHENQIISITLHQKGSGAVVPGMGFSLIVRNPDGNTLFEGELPLTNEEGYAELALERFMDRQNGDLLLYQICLKDNVTAPLCVNGSFLIWN